MEVSYRREMNHNYMIIGAPGESADGYECRMLAGNGIEGLLKFRVRHQGEQKIFYYEITSRQPLSRLFEQRKITGAEIRRLLLNLAATLNKMEEYLLREDRILLEPDYIYADQDQFFVSLCMVPGYSCDFPGAITNLLRFLLEKVDHQDRDGVVLAYHLYHESLKDNYGMRDLLKYLTKEEGPVFESKGLSARSDDPAQAEIKSEEGELPPKAYENRLSGKEWEGGEQEKGYGGEWRERECREQEYREREKSLKRKAVADKRGNKARGEALNAWAVTAGMLAALWFFAGKEAFMRFGILLGAVTLGLFYIKGRTAVKQERSAENLKNSLKGEGKKGRNTRGFWKTIKEKADGSLGGIKTEIEGRRLRKDEAAEKAGDRQEDTWRIHFDDRQPGQQRQAEQQQRQAEQQERQTGQQERQMGQLERQMGQPGQQERQMGQQQRQTEQPGQQSTEFLEPCEWISEKETERVETALLSDLSREGHLAVFESLSKDKDNIEIPYVPFIIGKRSDMTDYCLDHRTVSRLHLRIDKKEGVYIMTDLNSTNGTMVEGYQLQANETVSIKNGDLIYLAELGYRFTAKNG